MPESGTFVEKFDLHKLQLIADNKDKVSQRCDPNSHTYVDADEYAVARKFITHCQFNKQQAGKVEVSYAKSKADGQGQGRYYAVHGMSMQSMCREIRSTIANEHYRDIDMVNAHPVILDWLCSSLNIRFSTLHDLVTNREAIFADIQSKNPEQTRGQIKQMILAVVYGGTKLANELTVKTDWFKKFRKQMKAMRTVLSELFPSVLEARRKEKKAKAVQGLSKICEPTIKGATVAFLATVVENQLLMMAMEFLKSKLSPEDYETIVLCFDGLMIPKTFAEPYVAEYIEQIKQMWTEAGINMDLKVKEMEPLDLSDLTNAESNAATILLHSEFTDADVGDYFKHVYGRDFLALGPQLYRFNGVYWKKETDGYLSGILNGIHGDLHELLLRNYSGPKDKDFFEAAVKRIKRLRNSNPQAGMIKMIRNMLAVEEDPFDKNPLLLCFTNGVLDLSMSQFRTAQQDDYITQVVPYDYAPVEECVEDGSMREFNEFLKKVMPIVDERELLLQVLSSTLMGTTLENFIVLSGNGRNGKDTLITHMLRATLGSDFYYKANASAITDRQRGDLNVSIANMHKKRLVVYNEPNEHETVKVSTVKDLTGGQEIAARGLYSSNTSTKLAATHIMICNKKPRLDTVDDAIANRLVVIPFRSLFWTPEMLAELPPDTPHVYEVDTMYKEADFIERMRLPFLHRLLAAFRVLQANKYTIRNIPESIRAEAKSYLSDSDELCTWFLSEYRRVSEPGPADFVRLKEVYDVFKQSDFYCNMTKGDKRRMNYGWFTKEVSTNPNLRGFYRDKHRPRVQGAQLNVSNVLLNFRAKGFGDEE